jgi:hypothetical protein
MLIGDYTNLLGSYTYKVHLYVRNRVSLLGATSRCFPTCMGLHYLSRVNHIDNPGIPRSAIRFVPFVSFQSAETGDQLPLHLLLVYPSFSPERAKSLAVSLFSRLSLKHASTDCYRSMLSRIQFEIHQLPGEAVPVSPFHLEWSLQTDWLKLAVGNISRTGILLTTDPDSFIYIPQIGKVFLSRQYISRVSPPFPNIDACIWFPA